MKRAFYRRILLVVFTIAFSMPGSLSAVAQADAEKYSLIRAFEQDTTGDKVNDRIVILADIKNNGYIVEIEQHDGKTYRLKPASAFQYLAPYTPFYAINIQIADINNDGTPEIITWGSLTHENAVHIFRWDGRDYKIVYSGFNTGFRFMDITGDNVLELVTIDRIYGTGEETIYYQWQQNRYVKIYYEMDGNRGFDKIRRLLNLYCDFHADKSAYDNDYFEEYLENFFTDKWLAGKKNIACVKELGRSIFAVQIVKYLNQKIDYDATGNAIGNVWRLRLLVFTKDGEKIVPREMVMTAATRYVGHTEWKIDSVSFSA